MSFLLPLNRDANIFIFFRERVGGVDDCKCFVKTHPETALIQAQFTKNQCKYLYNIEHVTNDYIKSAVQYRSANTYMLSASILTGAFL